MLYTRGVLKGILEELRQDARIRLQRLLRLRVLDDLHGRLFDLGLKKIYTYSLYTPVCGQTGAQFIHKGCMDSDVLTPEAGEGGGGGWT